MRGRALAAALIAAVPVALLVGVAILADRTPDGDAPHLIGAELRLAQLLRDGEVVRAWRLFATLLAPQPPGGYLPGIATFVVLGARPALAALAMAVPLGLAWDALRRLDEGRLPWAGWLAFVASPLVWLYVEQHGRDLVAAAVVLQALSWLVAWTKEPGDRRAAALVGAWTGVGLLTKYTTPMFLFLPLLAALPRVAREGRTVGFAAGAALLVAGPWYLAYGDRVWRYVHHSAAAADVTQSMSARTSLLSADALLTYPLALKDALGWPGVAAVLAGAALGWRRGARGAVVLPILAAAGGLAVLSSLTQVHDRYALPAFACLAALALPLGHVRWGAAAAAGVFVPQLVASFLAFRPGAPALAAGTFDHPPDTAAALSWPTSRAYRPVDVDVDAWRVDDAVRALRAVHGADTGTVGLLLPRGPAVPGFGTFLLRAARLGYAWDWATVNLAAGRGGLPDPVFVGPLFDGDWPPRTFTALYAIERQPADADVARWLAAHRVERVEAFPLAGGGEGVVYRVR